MIDNGPASRSESLVQEALPVTSFPCQWNVPRKRKERSAKISDLKFQKHVYGRQQKHVLQPLHEFDPRPTEYRGTASVLLQSFLTSVKGKGLGVSVLLDEDTRVWAVEGEGGASVDSSESPSLPSRDELKERVLAFKKNLHLTPERIRQIERETKHQSQTALWFSARRYRLTASMFGKVYKRLPNTPPDCLVKELLHPLQFSTKATEWGRQHEPIALNAYVQHQIDLGHVGLVAVNAGFVVCEEHPFLGASPDAYINDPSSADQFGLAEVKCPYKYRELSPEDAAMNSDFCSSLCIESGIKVLRLKHTHNYYAQIQGQLAITERKWCDFILYTKKGLSVERIMFNADFWMLQLLPKLSEFYDNCFCPAIVSPVHLLGMKVHDLRV